MLPRGQTGCLQGALWALWAASPLLWDWVGRTPRLRVLGPDVSSSHRPLAAWRSSFPHIFIHPMAIWAGVPSCALTKNKQRRESLKSLGEEQRVRPFVSRSVDLQWASPGTQARESEADPGACVGLPWLTPCMWAGGGRSAPDLC